MIHVFAAATQMTLPFNPADYYQYLGPLLTAIVFIAHARGYKVPLLSAFLDVVMKLPSLPVPGPDANIAGPGSPGSPPDPLWPPLPPRPTLPPLRDELHTHSLLLTEICDNLQFVRTAILSSQAKAVADRAAAGPAPAPATSGPVGSPVA